jgi:hypothetical protein
VHDTARDAVVRRALWVSVPYNVVGALMFAFPETIGRVAGLPAPVPRVYTASLAVLVLLFGATYAWLALQPRIDRPLVAFSAIGKASVFTVVLVCWLLGEGPALGVLAASGDLALAAIFAWWLGTTPAA